MTILPASKTIRQSSQTDSLLRLLLSSMMRLGDSYFQFYLNESHVNFFKETVGDVYLIFKGGSYSFFEGYVIDAFCKEFQIELENYKLITSLEGRKSSAKGAPFEAVVVNDLLKIRGTTLPSVVSRFGITLANNNNLKLRGTMTKGVGDAQIIRKRPLNVYLRPSTLFIPDVLAFLSPDTLLSVGIKLYTSNISLDVHQDNLKSTDPALFFQKNGRNTILPVALYGKKSLKLKPIRLSVRFLIELPGISGSTCFRNIHKTNDNTETIVILITNENMEQLFSEDVCRLIRFITQGKLA